MNRSTQTARAAVFAGLMTGCILWSAAAFATDYDVVPQTAITVHDADFTSPRAIAKLKHKLDRAALEMCTHNADRPLIPSSSEQACTDTAIKDGLTQIDRRQQQAMRDRTVRLADTGTAQTASQ